MPTLVLHQQDSTTYKYANTPSTKAENLKSAARKKRFQDVFPRLRDELKAYFEECNMPREATEWFVENLNYNVPHGKLNRGLSVTDTVEILLDRPLDETEYFKAATLGWCVELLQAMFLVSDDIMDASVTRRGQPCWYRVPHVGTIAVNDSLMLEGCIYHLLKKHFRSTPYYVDLLELFHDVTYQTEMGQLVDLITAPENHVDLDKFNLEKHQFIVIFKTAFYSFYLPVALGMHMAGIKEPKSFDQARSILIPLGEYFQVQDDYLDCYGSPEDIGKIGTDIVDNKCSWNINIALKYASTEQRRILDQNYGKKDSEAEAKVKKIFNDIGVERRYKEYEEECYVKISELIEGIDESRGEQDEVMLKKQIFRAFLEKIYGRTK